MLTTSAEYVKQHTIWVQVYMTADGDRRCILQRCTGMRETACGFQLACCELCLRIPYKTKQPTRPDEEVWKIRMTCPEPKLEFFHIQHLDRLSIAQQNKLDIRALIFGSLLYEVLKVAALLTLADVRSHLISQATTINLP
jgi:hypothetical protein